MLTKEIDAFYKEDSINPLNATEQLCHPNENHFENKLLANEMKLPPSQYTDVQYQAQAIFRPEQQYPVSKSDPLNEIIVPKSIERRDAIPLRVNSDEKKQIPSKTTTYLSLPSRSLNVENSKTSISAFLQTILEHNIELGIMSFLTLFALFGSDIKSLAIHPNYDMVFNIVFIVVMIFFFLEHFISIVGMPGYLWSFFFWLDLLAACSMILEVEWFLIPILEYFLGLSFGSVENKQLMLISSKSRKIAMTFRILRIIRLIRIVKLYKVVRVFLKNRELKRRMEELRIKKREKYEKEIKLKEKRSRSIQKANSRRKPSRTNRSERNMSNHQYSLEDSKNTVRSTPLGQYPVKQSSLVSPSPQPKMWKQGLLEHTRLDALQALLEFQSIQKEEQAEISKQEETKISKVVSESITQKVIIMILLLLFMSPLTDDDVYSGDSNLNYMPLCKLLNNIFSIYGGLGPAMNQSLINYIDLNNDEYFPIITINNNYTLIYNNTPYSLRYDEIGYSYSPEGDILITYSNKANTFLSALINVCRTIFACIVLFSMAYLLGHDSKTLILNPLEVMINVVDTVAKDPVNYKTLEDLKKNIKNSIEQMKKKNKMRTWDEFSVDYEIKIIQFAIIRISALMAIGFGEAGGEILRENIGSCEGLNPMLPGKRIYAIFGFCFIRKFSEINEVLQEKTMVFVNQIAEIVHSCVDKFGGAANKNIGDCFLLVWKFHHLGNESTDDENGNPNLSKLDLFDRRNKDVADQAVLAFLNIIKKINKSSSILSYRNDPLLRKKFNGKFRVQMGFGLHMGWGIEGAIGSFYKIDCSYLSPNVNIAARLETGTNIYGVDILISGEVYELLSEFMQDLCRLIDVVKLKGCETPVKLYTVDVNTDIKPGKTQAKKLTMREKRNIRSSKKAKLRAECEKNSHLSIGDIYYSKSKGLRALLNTYKSDSFLTCFKEGLKCYVKGKWDEAYKHLRAAYYIDKTDGPSKTLLRFIKSHSKVAPDGWEGCRKLEAKS